MVLKNGRMIYLMGYKKKQKLRQPIITNMGKT